VGDSAGHLLKSGARRYLAQSNSYLHRPLTVIRQGTNYRQVSGVSRLRLCDLLLEVGVAMHAMVLDCDDEVAGLPLRNRHRPIRPSNVLGSALGRLAGRGPRKAAASAALFGSTFMTSSPTSCPLGKSSLAHLTVTPFQVWVSVVCARPLPAAI
jgi:hypothetical protein